MIALFRNICVISAVLSGIFFGMASDASKPKELTGGVMVNGKFVAKGEVVVIEESFAVRVTEIIK